MALECLAISRSAFGTFRPTRKQRKMFAIYECTRLRTWSERNGGEITSLVSKQRNTVAVR